jgi:hypothetical protein
MPTIDLTDNELAEVIAALRKVIERLSALAPATPVQGRTGETSPATCQANPTGTAADAHGEADTRQAGIAKPLGHKGKSMPDERGWPDENRPGYPSDPNKEGPHLIRNEHGQRLWYFWYPHGNLWYSRGSQCGPVTASKKWEYLGAALPPDGQPI